MPFAPGQSGNPGGMSKRKQFREALQQIINDRAGDHKRLLRIAEQLLTMAENGDLQAIKEVADRLDGKPPQSVGGDDDATPIRHVFEWLTPPPDES